MSALLCGAAVFAAGCHHNNNISGYGIGWTTLTETSEVGQFSSYIVNVDSITLTGVVDGVITALATPETVDFTKLKDISELWSAANIPVDTYTTASIVLDYTTADISVMVNGVPVKATVTDPTGVAVTTMTINVTLDPTHQLVSIPTYASTDAKRMALNFDLAASNDVNTAVSPPTVRVKPIMTLATSASDSKPIRIRGPLINSSLGEGTYSIYVRPFFDEVNTLGTLTIFNTANTVYTLSGTTYVGSPGLTALSHTSAGTTMTAAYTTFKPSATPSAVAGIFTSTFVVAGSTLEDYYTQGLEGDVIARSGNTLTLRGATLQLNDGTSTYNVANSVVLVGAGTIVTAEDNTTLKGLDYNSISVGQHIIARGIYELPASGVVTLDATGTSSTNTGSVRLQSTQIYGSLVSTATAGLVLDLSSIENWPVSVYNFAGAGAAAVSPASYSVDTGSIPLPTGLSSGSPLWISGLTTPFGSAPPDFDATTITAEASQPATLEVDWIEPGTVQPFKTATSSGLTIDLAAADLSAEFIRVGPEIIQLKALSASPTIVPVATPAPVAGLPDLFLPLFSIGGLTATDTTTVASFNSFATFVSHLPTSIVTATPALKFVANGTYNRASNVFTATTIDVVN